MKICLPTIGEKGFSEMVYNHFGSAHFFTIYDTDSKSIQIVKNDNKHHNHGACQPLEFISKYNIDAIITNGMGRRAIQLLNNKGIKVYLLDGSTVKDAIEKFEKNELSELKFENACGGHNHTVINL